MKILLTYQSGQPDRSSPYINLVPTGLGYLHACLKEAGYESMLANFSAWPVTRIRKELRRFAPTVIGISQWTHNRHCSMALARLCRETLPEALIIMGGGHATFCYEDILTTGSPVDVVVRGEGEATLLELINNLSNRSTWQTIAGLAYREGSEIVVTGNRPPIDMLDTLPLPARYFESSVGIDKELQAEFIVTTRGCPSACTFCSSPDFWGRKVRFRSPEAVVEEIRYIRDHFGLIYFSIRDDTFTADRNRVLHFCHLLQKQNIKILWNCQSRVSAIDRELLIAMKRAGCECVQLGIESASPAILDYLGKRISPEQIVTACREIKTVGINLSVYLISNIPDESAADTRQTIELLRKIQPDDGYVSPLAYYPGTSLYKKDLASGIASADLFAASQSEALYVTRNTPGTSKKLMQALARTPAQDKNRFARQKTLLGYCHTTNVIAGEWYRALGETAKAEQEFTQIIELEPDNPWGWLLLGDLYTELGMTTKSRNCYRKVTSIVPNHPAARHT